MRTPRTPRPARAAVALAVAGAIGLTGCTTGDTADDTVPVEVISPSPTDGTEAPSDEATPVPTTPAPTPAPTTSAPPTSTPAPTGVAVGEVVEGFPVDVVPVLPESEVTLSNVVEAEGGGRTVALAGRTSRSAEEVVAYYTAALTDQGFTATTPPGVEGAVVTTFSRAAAAELLTLSVISSGDLQDFSIGGRLA